MEGLITIGGACQRSRGTSSPTAGSSLAAADEAEGQCAINCVANMEKASPDIVTWYTIGDRGAADGRLV